MRISKEAKKKILEDVTIRADLMKVFKVSEKTITNWVDKDDLKLTTKQAVDSLITSTGLSEDQILDSEAIHA